MVGNNKFLFHFLDNNDNIMEEFIMKDEDIMSNCCSAPFTYPGWPDSDMCSKCYEHADTWEEEDG